MDCLVINGVGAHTFGVGFGRAKMEDTAARDDACREYESSLEDLTFNSKPHINMLTILAEENISFAKDIVGIIEAQISKAPANEKLPVLYLVDSIVKNVGREYLAVFAKNLITSFICVFEKVDENTRKSLFKLRSTWDDVFPPKKLYALDVRVNCVDPAWPIKPLPPAANSIHVNPKFLKQADEPPAVHPVPPQPAASQPAPVQPVPVQPVPVVQPVAPVPAAGLPVTPSSLTQEQLIRQQLLAKQKQLLELQQKKIELELEQTKAQLAGGFVLPQSSISSLTPKAIVPPATMIRPWIPTQAATTEAKQAPPAVTVTTTTTTSAALTPSAAAPPTMRDPRLNRPTPGKELKKDISPAADRKNAEKHAKADKVKLQRVEETAKSKSKSPPPMTKTVPNKNNKSVEDKKDPRLKKRTQDKPDVEEIKYKKRREEEAKDVEDLKKKRDEVSKKAKLVNGSVTTKEEFKMGGNARTHARKRSRSRSRSPNSLSPKCSNNGSSRGGSKEKDRRSPKAGSRGRSNSPSPHKSQKNQRARSRDGRGTAERGGPLGSKKNQSESGRRKRGGPDDRDSPRGHEPGSKEAKDVQHRWRSGWEDSKHTKDEPHKSATPRHKSYPSPRTPKHRLSVDANLQIPEVLNSASKKDLLRRASKRLENGEISEEEFLNLAHQIKHLFQYQEEKQQRRESWDQSPKTSSSGQGHGPQRGPSDGMDPAQASYYEHKSKLRKSQVSHRPPSDEWPEEEEEEEEYRAPRDRPGEQRSKEREEPARPMIEDYNHGKEFPPLKSLPGLRFKRRADPRDTADREWISPLSERQRLDEEVKSGYDRRFPERRPEPPSRNPQELPRFERERLSPLPAPHPAPRDLPRDQPDASPVPRFESPNSEHSEEGPMEPGPPQDLQPKSILKVRHDDGSERGYSDQPPISRPQQGWFDSGPRFEPPARFNTAPEHFDHMTHSGPMRGFDGAHPRPQGPIRFEQRFEPPMQRFEGPRFNNGAGPMGFQPRPPRFDAMFDGPGPRPRPGFDGPRFEPRFPQQQQQPMRPLGPPMFDGPMGPQQGFNMGPQHFPEPSMNAPFPQNAPMGFQGPNYIQPGPFNQPQGGFYPPGPNPGLNPGLGMQQPVNMMGNMNPPFMPQNTVPFPQAAPAPENHFGQVDVNDLLSKLISTGIIKPSQPEGAANAPPTTAGCSTTAPAAAVVEEEEEEEELSEEDLPDLTSFSLDTMKQRYESAVTRLYTGNQCCLCSMRFTAAQTDLYADHLDWHFRQNHAGKMAAKKVTHRRWYYSLTDWIEFEEIADLEERAKSQFFEKENEEEEQKNQAAAKEKEFQSVRATKDQVAELCEICQEPFETYWVEEEEDWFLKNAIRVDDKNFHPSCFEDYQKSSYIDATPSPSKHLTEHPLSVLCTEDKQIVLIKTEDEGGASCMEAGLKQEMDSDVMPIKLAGF